MQTGQWDENNSVTEKISKKKIMMVCDGLDCFSMPP